MAKSTGKGTRSKQQRKNIKNGTAEVGGSYFDVSHKQKADGFEY
jgi:hypothetical protein